MSTVFNLTAYENQIAVINENGGHYYYGDLIDSCNKIGSFLGQEEKKLVIIQAGNNIETIAGYLGVIQNNHAAMLVDAALDKNLLDNLTGIYRPEYTWRPRENGGSALYRYKNYELVEYEFPGRGKLHPDISVLLSTSGSTGSPKFVRLTKGNIAANARSIAAYLKITGSERPVTNLPFHYSYGLSIINSHLIAGAAILLTDKPVVKKEFWDFFKSRGGTSLAGVPYTYEILNSIGFPGMELPSLRYMTQAGGKMETQLILQYAKLSRQKHFDFYVMYGATEATARISYLPPDYNILKAGSIGVAIPEGKILLVDEYGTVITEPNTEGEVAYLGPNVMMGYAHCRADLGRDDELFGMLKPGDIGYFDEDGFFYITGRKSRFLKILGKRIGLAEIESHLKTLHYDCICGGKDDMLLIACHDEDIFDEVRKEVFTRFKIPLDLIHAFRVEHVPRNAFGKISYSKIFSHQLNRRGQES